MQLVGPFPNHQTHAPLQNAPLNWEHLEWYWLIPRGTVGKFLFDLFLFLFACVIYIDQILFKHLFSLLNYPFSAPKFGHPLPWQVIWTPGKKNTW